ncbi:MAG: hypothetical protein A3F11_11735 [Gammaproteobacteria bacterium RIFCSPHIGHO2_12_FULL_37_14]|nr:MAG: hypothetical protein A3F11_11735 [Gammaproteobacteria bacterium RIFCSPHIGHO2_12_FULL_37_14]
MFRQHAATKIQNNFRTYLAQKKYQVQELSPNAQTNYPTHIVGNDPVMTDDIFSYKSKKDEKIALIATGGMRALMVACQLNNSNETPKIILIDNSKIVCTFWRELRKFSEENKNEDSFLSTLPSFLKKHEILYEYQFEKHHAALPDIQEVLGTKLHNQNSYRFFSKIINEFGYKLMRSIILHTTVIAQTWVDPIIFSKIKNILSLHNINNIYMYPSNIAFYVKNEDRMKVLKNIDNMRPTLSIQTDLNPTLSMPGTIFFIQKNHAESVYQEFFLKTDHQELMMKMMLGLIDSEMTSKKVVHIT